MSCGVGCRHGSDPALLWRRPVATAPIRPLAWEPPYAMGAAQENGKKTKKNLFSIVSRGHDAITFLRYRWCTILHVSRIWHSDLQF